MTGRALAAGTLCFVTIGLLGLSSRVAAQSSDDEEDMSTGEITEEVSTTDSISDGTSTDDNSSDDSSPPHGGIQGIPRPKTPLQPTR
jgi:hypothetical protein